MVRFLWQTWILILFVSSVRCIHSKSATCPTASSSATGSATKSTAGSPSATTRRPSASARWVSMICILVVHLLTLLLPKKNVSCGQLTFLSLSTAANVSIFTELLNVQFFLLLTYCTFNSTFQEVGMRVAIQKIVSGSPFTFQYQGAAWRRLQLRSNSVEIGNFLIILFTKQRFPRLIGGIERAHLLLDWKIMAIALTEK